MAFLKTLSDGYDSSAMRAAQVEQGSNLFVPAVMADQAP